MKRAIALIVLISAGCQSQTPGAAYVAADRLTHDSFAATVARDVAAGHQDSQFVFDSWTRRLESAERAATQP